RHTRLQGDWSSDVCSSDLLKDAPVYSSGVQAELVTPTGAAVVKILASRFATFPEMKIEKSGYGAGSREFPELPNVLRLTIGESRSEERRGGKECRCRWWEQ